MKDDLTGKAVVKVMQFATYDSLDPCIEREQVIECTESTDDIVELAFDLSRSGRRTYLRMNREDLLRMIRLESP